MSEPLIVSRAEAGQKLFQFLTRRFNTPQSALHRWIRSGQVRINGKRAKAFDRVAENDQIRIPPFAEATDAKISTIRASGLGAPTPGTGPALPPLAAETADLLVFNKPAGLPTQPGTGHMDSLVSRLAAHYADAPFRPTPAHRLDKDTSGLLLVAKNYTTLRRLADAFAAHDGTIIKEYLAWVAGSWPDSGAGSWPDSGAGSGAGSGADDAPVLLEARLLKATDKEDADQRERVRVLASDDPAGKTARLTVRCVTRTGTASLLHIRLHTGRTHQIRAQLSSAGFPLIGDVKYGGPPCRSGLKLHAARLRVDGVTYESLPPADGPSGWHSKWAVQELPPALVLCPRITSI